MAERLGELLGRSVPLKANWVDGVDVKPSEVVLLENCRVNKGEKKNDEALAKKIAALCDIFVHDAFGTAHRAEASTYGIANTFLLAAGPPIGKSLEKDVGYISTGGGAFLEVLEGKTLPAFEILQRRAAQSLE